MYLLALITSDFLLSALACTTFFKSSTEYEWTFSTSLQSAPMFLGTEMSISWTAFSRPDTSAALRMGSLLAVAAKITSLLAMTSIISSMEATFAFLPPRAATSSSSNMACALATLRLTTVTCASGFLLKSAMSNNLDILPAPKMQMCTLFETFRRSPMDLAIINSTAALDTDTEPLPIFVRVRTSLPIRMPAFNILAMILPPEPA
mmetsp:Transcript_97971/g.247220  ORF Transcript_97971/g.247220 Transcript_97971/m.247220 type:complete len:205 (-) Transcript_97971:1354-1968(-)